MVLLHYEIILYFITRWYLVIKLMCYNVIFKTSHIFIYFKLYNTPCINFIFSKISYTTKLILLQNDKSFASLDDE